jgi:hypothetical protein
MDWVNKKAPSKNSRLWIENGKSARVYPSPKLGLIMITKIILDDAELNMTVINYLKE